MKCSDHELKCEALSNKTAELLHFRTLAFYKSYKIKRINTRQTITCWFTNWKWMLILEYYRRRNRAMLDSGFILLTWVYPHGETEKASCPNFTELLMSLLSYLSPLFFSKRFSQTRAFLFRACDKSYWLAGCCCSC